MTKRRRTIRIFAEKVGSAVLDRTADRAVLICGSGSGVGASVAANQLNGIRAGMCRDTYSAHQGVDNINVLVLGERVIGVALVRDLVAAFLGAKFTNEERHVRRLGKIAKMEDKFCDK